MVTLHEVITFLVSMQISISSLQTHRSEERFSRNAETDIVCRLLLEKKMSPNANRTVLQARGEIIPVSVENGDALFFNDTPTTDIYNLSLHDALPISAS